MKSAPPWLRWFLRFAGAPMQWGYAFGLVLAAWQLPGPLSSVAGAYLIGLVAGGAAHALRDIVGGGDAPGPWVPAGGVILALVAFEAAGEGLMMWTAAPAALFVARELLARRYSAVTP